MSQWNKPAPDGQIWVCGACNREAKRVVDIGDESCWLNAVLCYERTDKERAERRATAVEGS